MMTSIRVACAQLNSTVGDLEGNRQKICECLTRASSLGVELIAFPELAVCGYPPEDLLLKEKFIADNLSALQGISAAVGDEIVAIVGFVDHKGSRLYNAAAVICGGKIRGVYHKTLLPNYGVFDEQRYFTAGESAPVFALGKVVFGVNICEDIWHAHGPLGQQARQGARLIININASPYHMGKVKEREAVIFRQARRYKAPIVHTNLVGGQDELVFDGQSMVVAASGKVLGRAAAFREDLLITDLEVAIASRLPAKAVVVAKACPVRQKIEVPPAQAPEPLEPLAEVYQALVLGLHDYVHKNGFQKVVIGLSGGIDSSLVATLAADALGREQVVGIFMPTHYSSQESLEDARQVAQNLGMTFLSLSIEQIYKMYLLAVEPHFAGAERNITEENIQARIRGTLMMAFSNKFGWMVLTTGNKSEMSTGYATLYGDMAGGFAVIKDVPKQLVYQLAQWRNARGPVIPERVFTKEPTAELRPNQKDRDTLPPYDLLDSILKAYIEEDYDLRTIVSLGFDEATARRVMAMVDRSEYKRRQSPPGIKITPKAFGKDRRMPITNKYRG